MLLPLTVPLPLPALLKDVSVVIEVGPAVLEVIQPPLKHSLVDCLQPGSKGHQRLVLHTKDIHYHCREGGEEWEGREREGRERRGGEDRGRRRGGEERGG